MSDMLFDSIARIARHEAKSRAVAGVGKVTSVFPTAAGTPDYAVSVEMRDSGLVLPHVPVAAGMLGAVVLPAVDELVVVLFADGDYHAPIVVGRLYHPDQNPPQHQQGHIVMELPSGADDPALKLKIEGAKPSIALELPGSEVKIEIVEGKISLTVAEMQLSVESNGGGRTEIKAGNATITLKKDGDVSVETQGKLTLKGNEIEINGSSKVAISGGTVEIN